TEQEVILDLWRGHDTFTVHFCGKRGGNTAWFEVHARAAERPPGVWPMIEPQAPTLAPGPAPGPQLQWYYFKLTNSHFKDCFVTAVLAANADQARELAQRQATNYTVTQITAEEYYDPKTCRRK